MMGPSTGTSSVNENVRTLRKKRQRITAGVLSVLFMGAGQFLNGQWLKGIVFALFEVTCLFGLGRRLIDAITGLITLGDVPGRDHSIYMLINGMIAIIATAVILAFYALNVWDAYRVGKLIDAGHKPAGTQDTIRAVRHNGFPFFMLTPSLALLAGVSLLPLLFSISLAFTNYDLYHVPPGRLVDWVGFSNFTALFTLSSWKNSMLYTLQWSIIWTICSVVTTFALGLFFAVILENKDLKFKSFFRTILILPWAIPGFVLLLGFTGFFNASFGPVNQILGFIGLPEIRWFESVLWARVMVLAVNLYLGFPFMMVLCSGVIQGIDTSMYEAARVDGATGWQQFVHVTFPMVMYSVAPLLIMQFAGAFYNFNGIYLLTGGGPAIAGLRGAGGTDILISWVFKMSFDTLNKYNYASAISLMIFVIVVFLSIWNFRRTRQFREEGVIS